MHITFPIPAHTYTLTKDSHNTGNFMPYVLFSNRLSVGSLTSHIELINMEGIFDTGTTIYRPFPRRLECLTICWFNYKGSTFYSVIFKTLSVGPAGVEFTTSRMTARYSTK